LQRRMTLFKAFPGLAVGISLSIGLLSATQPANASTIRSTGTNLTFDTAQVINGPFTLDRNPNIQDSTTIPHVTIEGTGVATPFGDNSNFFLFNIAKAGSRGIFDIDFTRSIRNVLDRDKTTEPTPGTENRFNTLLRLYDSSKILVEVNDNDVFTLGRRGSVADPFLGSNDQLSLDAFLDIRFATVGAHYLEVNFLALNGFARQRGEYSLQASVQAPEPIPTPSLALGMLGMGIASARSRLQRKRQGIEAAETTQ
jgi:hypothetical protein